MLIPRLALHSLRSRMLTTSLTIVSIALSVTLLVGIANVRAGVRESFAGTIRGVDLIVGARGGTLQVMLSSVFGIGSPSGSVSMATFERWQKHPAVKWAVPYALGDSHRGYRVVGTNEEFYQRYHFRNNASIQFVQGRAARADSEVVIGSEVAERLGYEIGSPVVVVHGLVDIGTSSHEAHPFRVVGILGRTFTPIDRTVYVTLEGITAMHESSTEAGQASTSSTPMAMPGAAPPPMVMPAAPTGQQLTSFFVGTKNRFEALALQREMNTDFTEPLTAVIPGVALGELWKNIGSAEVGLQVVAIFAVAIGLAGMLVALYSSLEARRREMAIFRAIGAGPRTIVALLVLESTLLSLVGCALGVAFVYAALALGQQPIEQRFGLHLAIRPLGSTEWMYLAIVLLSGVIIGFVPAVKAYRTSLVDGLSPRA
jgi:putative ABC transport system permease protein